MSKQKKFTKKKAAKVKRTTKKRAELRTHRRLAVKDLFISERCDGFLYISKVKNISLGGLYLEKRMGLSNTGVSLITLQGVKGPLTLEAEVVRDEVSKDSFGAGYRFINLTKESSKSLNLLLRNLN